MEMTLHRLLGFRAAVADPDALASYYGELGLSGDAQSGFTGSAGGAAVRLEQAPIRRLLDVELGCSDDGDIARIARQLADRGASVEHDGDHLSVTDGATRVRFTV
ncbi:MAG TPA: hypothetical protein VGI86_13950, partial [Acidimicrobiia bacterium]